MAPPTATTPPPDVYWTLRAAERDLGFCVLAFPVMTFSGALLIGLWGSLDQMRHVPAALLWIVLGVCALLSALAVLSVRTAHGGLARAGMPLREIRCWATGVWTVAAGLMIGLGASALGYVAITFDPERKELIAFFGPVARPLPLVIVLVLYTLAGALLLGRSWRKLQEAKAALPAEGSEEAAMAAEWSRSLALFSGGRSSVHVFVFVVCTFFLALLIALGNRGSWPGTSRLVMLGLLALCSSLSVLLMRRSRRHYEAAGLSPEDVRHELASTWRTGGVLMIAIGLGALVCVYLAFDLLTPADRPLSLGSAAGYTSIGLLLLWFNRRKRST